MFLISRHSSNEDEEKVKGLQRCVGEEKGSSRWRGMIATFEETRQN